MKNLRKIRATIPDSIRKHITDTLRESILEGEIKPGERINELFISEKLGVSRSPIREAIRALEAENLVETFDRRGSFVREITVRDVDEVYQVLSMLEGNTVSLAIANLSVVHKKKLKSVLRRIANITQKTSLKKVNALAREFHKIITEATRNKVLIKLRSSLRVQEEIFHRAIFQRANGQEWDNVFSAAAEHLAIGNAILESDHKTGEELMNQHVKNARERAVGALERKAKLVSSQEAT